MAQVPSAVPTRPPRNTSRAVRLRQTVLYVSMHLWPDMASLAAEYIISGRLALVSLATVNSEIQEEL